MRLSGAFQFAAPLFFCTYAALAHESTKSAFEASLDPREAKVLAAAASLGEATRPSPASSNTAELTVRLIEAETKLPLAGIVRITRANGTAVALPGLVDRGLKLRANHPAKDWFVVPGPVVLSLPQEELQVAAFAGLETELASRTIDLRGQSGVELVLPLRRFASPAKTGWHSGNTHLHLSGMTRPQAEEYLRVIPRGDGLELVFVSYLSRAEIDRDYVSNGFSSEDLQALSGGGVTFGNGEEHRHNFGTFGKGYGHVMFLNIRRLVQPVSIGSGIMGGGLDFPPLRRGIEQARQEGATVIWCHGASGFEDVPDSLAGLLQAHNIFDGGSQSSYSDSFYRFLNVGLKVPFSTGTDWFIYDFSRVYARVDQPLTVPSWLQALVAGRTFITNGPFLELRAGPHEIGDTVALAAPGHISLNGRATGRGDFRRIELIQDGNIVCRAMSHAVGGHFEAELEFSLEVNESGWVALRVGGGSLDTGGSLVIPSGIPFHGSGKDRNEMGEALFGHTSPIYLEIAGRPVFRRADAQELIADLETSLRTIQTKAQFADEPQRNEVLGAYREGIAMLRRRLQE
ncbi:MAG: hypothetical protein EXS39_05440 [Opitutaceae bacterium]|nr:hypothetical protein [Opitutaceae bacterium]